MKLNAAQYSFLAELPTKYRAYISGYGGGKTFVGCIDLLNFAGQHPKTVQGYFGPSYPTIRDVFYPTLEEVGNELGYTVDIKEGNKEAHIYRGRLYYGTIICRSMDRPGSIVGFKIARALVDEIDTLPKNKAHQAWNKIIARLRLVIPGVENGIGVTTTPEGFLFVYEKFGLDPTESYSMVQASTYENAEHLPPDYINTLIETYPSELVAAYVNGQFVNLKAGTVYRSYDRTRNGSDEQIKDREPLCIGMDFNRGKMAACIFVKRENGWHCVGEIKDGIDTPWIIDVVKERYSGHHITIYPDASGQNASSKGASLSDIALLRDAGFTIKAKKSNPLVKDRVNAGNKAFEDQKVWVNAKLAPETAKCLEQQAYDKNGEPDKKTDLDHQNDAFTYPVAYEFPVKKPLPIFTSIQTAI